MRRRSFLTLLGVLLGCRPPRRRAIPFQRGMALDGFPGSFALSDFERLRELGVEWVSMYPYGYMVHHRDPAVYRFTEPDRPWWLHDEALLETGALAREAGLHIVVQPHLQDFRDGHWRGETEMDSEDDWRRWFESYRDFISHFAELADEIGAEGFCIGAELLRTVHREQEWRATVAAVRSRFPGWLTYAANWWREVPAVPWWDAVDAIGVQAYYGLGLDTRRPALDLTWRHVREHLGRVAKTFDRPVVFTEIGYKSHADSTREPWVWERVGERDDALQARAYEAVSAAFFEQPWFAGMYWWNWQAERRLLPDWERSFTPQHKDAERVIERWYTTPSQTHPRASHSGA